MAKHRSEESLVKSLRAGSCRSPVLYWTGLLTAAGAGLLLFGAVQHLLPGR